MRPFSSLFLALIILFPGAAAWADSTAERPGAASAASRIEACPPPPASDLNTAQTTQTDCCKGHKGVCGCRAGKIVCCDNTVSANCTCHGDSGLEN